MPLDTQQQTVRFHQLFRDLVFNELRLRRPDELASLHRRAAEAERAAGDIPAAVRHYLAAGDADAAFGLVVTPVWDLYRAGRTRDAAVWLGQFSEEFVAEDPGRILSYAVALSFVGRLDDAARVERTERCRSWRATSHSPRSWRSAGCSSTSAGPTPPRFAPISSSSASLRPGRSFDWDPTGRVITIMAIAALVDEDLDEAGAWVAAIEAASSMPERRESGRPSSSPGMAGDRTWVAGRRRAVRRREPVVRGSRAHRCGSRPGRGVRRQGPAGRRASRARRG